MDHPQPMKIVIIKKCPKLQMIYHNFTSRLECNEQCGIMERNRRVALALEISNPDLSGKLGTPTYTQALKDFAR